MSGDRTLQLFKGMRGADQIVPACEVMLALLSNRLSGTRANS